METQKSKLFSFFPACLQPTIDNISICRENSEKGLSNKMNQLMKVMKAILPDHKDEKIF